MARKGSQAPKSVEEYDNLSPMEKVNLALFRSSIWKMIQDAKQLDSDMEFINGLVATVLKNTKKLRKQLKKVKKETKGPLKEMNQVLVDKLKPGTDTRTLTPSRALEILPERNSTTMRLLRRNTYSKLWLERELKANHLLVDKLLKEVEIRQRHRSEINIALMMSHVTKELYRLDSYDYSQSAKKIEYEIESFLENSNLVSKLAKARARVDGAVEHLEEASTEVMEELISEILFVPLEQEEETEEEEEQQRELA
jgi:hypothetical protein